MTKYSLQILTLNDADGGFNRGYFSKGHHDPLAFANAIKEQWCGDEFTADTGAESPEDLVSKVTHTYYRSVPHPEFGRVLDESKPGRGAYPVTVFEK